MKQVQVSLYNTDYFIIYFRFGFYWLFFFKNILLSISKRRWQQNHNPSLSFAIFATIYIYIYFFFLQIHLHQILHNQTLKGPILNQSLLHFLLTSLTQPNLGFLELANCKLIRCMRIYNYFEM